MFNREQLNRIEALLTRVDAALVVRDPGTSRSVEAYEGLRKQVAVASRARRQHVAQLVEIADALDRGATAETIRDRVEEWMMQAGVERRCDPSVLEYFEVVEGNGDGIEVLTPAWVDTESGSLVRAGRARRIETISPDVMTTQEGAAPTVPMRSEQPDGDRDGGNKGMAR